MHWKEQAELASRALSAAKITVRGKLRVDCPICYERTGKLDKKTSLSGNTKSGRFYCYKCGASGRFAESQYDPNNTLAEDDGIKLFDPPSGFIPLWKYPGDSAVSTAAARSYLLKRGCEQSLWATLQAGCCLSGYYASTVVMPIMLSDSAWAGYVCRTFVPSDKPYRYPPEMDKGKVFFNGDALWRVTDVPLLVVEGVFDAVPFWPDAVAVLGKLSGEQRIQLALARRPVCVVLDGDAWEEGWSLAMWLRLQGQRAGHIRLPPRIDPDEVDHNWLLTTARESITDDL